MSQENIEIVRAYFAALDQVLTDYWRTVNRPPLRDYQGIAEVFERFTGQRM